MTEFQFSCPQCGGRIQCDMRYAGTQIGCPVCQQPITVPPAPAKSRTLRNVLIVAALAVVLVGLGVAGWFGYSKIKSHIGFGNSSASAGSIFDGSTLDGWTQIPVGSWKVTDGAMASTGAGRGVIYTAEDYSHYRLTFLVRHVSGNPDHQPCILFFCTRPADGAKPLDALGGVQFQVPNGGHWDYRSGHNNGGNAVFTALTHPNFNNKQWSQVEILVDASKGTARMAVAQPPGSQAVEVLDFNDPTAGKTGPIAWQMHNKGLFDEYKDVKIEVDPAVDDLLTTK